MKISAGINGFGRFGIHLLKYWLERERECNFCINYINDDHFTQEQIVKIIQNDKYVSFSKYKIKSIDNFIRILEPNGKIHKILISNNNKNEIAWIGEPEFFFECSGKNTVKKDCELFLKNNTKLVIISATSWDADQTLVYGFNHEEFANSSQIISYGSCTVNAYVPLHNYLNKKYNIVNSDVNVIHNIQEYKVSENNTLIRKFCTLEKSAYNLIEGLNENNFLVNYTLIPYSGVSMIDFRFALENCPSKNEIIDDLENQIHDGKLKNIYGMIDKDLGPEVHNCTVFSSVFIKENIKVIDNQLYIQAYFDNENSVNRFYDLLNFLSNKI